MKQTTFAQKAFLLGSIAFTMQDVKAIRIRETYDHWNKDLMNGVNPPDYIADSPKPYLKTVKEVKVGRKRFSRGPVKKWVRPATIKAVKNNFMPVFPPDALRNGQPKPLLSNVNQALDPYHVLQRDNQKFQFDPRHNMDPAKNTDPLHHYDPFLIGHTPNTVLAQVGQIDYDPWMTELYHDAPDYIYNENDPWKEELASFIDEKKYLSDAPEKYNVKPSLENKRKKKVDLSRFMQIGRADNQDELNDYMVEPIYANEYRPNAIFEPSPTVNFAQDQAADELTDYMVEPQYANEYRPNAIFEPSPTVNLAQADQGYDNVWREKNVRFSNPDQWWDDAPQGYLVRPQSWNWGQPADTSKYLQRRRAIDTINEDINLFDDESELDKSEYDAWKERNVKYIDPNQWYNDAPKGFLVKPWTGNNGHPADTSNYQQSRRYSPEEGISQDQEGYDNVWREKNLRFSNPDQWWADAPKGYIVRPYNQWDYGKPADTSAYAQGF